MIASFKELLEAAEARTAAVGAFTAYNLEGGLAVLRAAEDRSEGVMLLVSAQAFATRGGPTLVAALHVAAERAAVPCCIQLDHAADLATMEAALEAGAGALMADGSRLPYDVNVQLVTAAVKLAERFGAEVEAELGHVGGDEELATAAARGALTEPSEAKDFVEQTGAHCLAVSIGNVHGRYASPPQLDWERLATVHRQLTTPLSLHGASGLPDADLLRAVRSGIRKVNVNTELRERWFEVLADRAATLQSGAQLLTLNEELIGALAEIAGAKLELLSGSF